MSKVKQLFSKKKNIVVIVILLGLVLFFIIGGIIFYPLTKTSGDLAAYKKVLEFPDKYENYQTVQCDFHLKKSEYAFVNEQIFNDVSYYEIMFYTLSRNSIFSQEWGIVYNDSADISNTTFPELVSMAKEDCNQFKQSYPTETNPRKEGLGNMYWMYSNPNKNPLFLQQQQQKIRDVSRQTEEDQKEVDEFLRGIYQNLDYTLEEVRAAADNPNFSDEDAKYAIEHFFPQDQSILDYYNEDIAREWINYLISRGFLEAK